MKHYIEIGERLKDILKKDLEIIESLYPGERTNAMINFNNKIGKLIREFNKASKQR